MFPYEAAPVISSMAMADLASNSVHFQDDITRVLEGIAANTQDDDFRARYGLSRLLGVFSSMLTEFGIEHLA
jgi:hypothetical protein